MAENRENGGDQNGQQGREVVRNERGNSVIETFRMRFLILGLDLPPPPLFKDVMEKNIIPQVHLSSRLFQLYSAYWQALM